MYGRIVFAALFSIICFAALSAEGWSRYQNARYGYGLEVPPGFSLVREADNGDGGTSRADQGRATLAVWGANLLAESFKSDVNQRIEDASASGWDIVYRSVKSKGASWSGTKDDRILYAHAAPGCEGQAAYFQIEYDSAAKDDFDAVVKRMVKSFSPKGECL